LTRKKLTGKWRKLHIENTHTHTHTCIIWMIKPRDKIGGKCSTNWREDKGPRMQEFGGKA